MNPVEITFLWSAYSLYSVSVILYIAGLLLRKDFAGKAAWIIFLTAFSLQTVSILIRWVITGHPPVMVTLEHAQSGSWFVALVFLFLGFMSAGMRSMHIPACVVILVMLSFGIASGMDSIPLAPQYQSPWLWFHVSFAWLSWGAYVIASGLGLFYILKTTLKTFNPSRLFPSAEMTDIFIFRLIFFGFITQGLMIVTGAIWGHNLWGKYWSWDPIETWSLISWMVYGIFLHLRLTLNWKGRKAAWYAFLALITNIIYFWGLGLIKSTHTSLM